MRLAFERLGGAWIKLGQMLALRFDLLPAAYCDELFKLLNQVAPFPYAEVREIVRQELGGEPEAVFRSFATESFAAASIGQVHRAVLHNGDAVAVKVQRPGIRETLQADIDLMYAMTWLLDWTHLFGATRSREVIDEFARWTADELDYLVEARQAVLLWEHARGDRHERIARVYRDYTTSRVLTTELIEGIPLIEIMVADREGDREYLDALEARGHDLDRIVRHLDWNMLNQVFVFGYFHADLHPANLFVLPGRRHRVRRLRDRRPAPGSRPRLADPLQLAAVPRRGRSPPSASSCAGLRRDPRPTPRRPAGSSSASTRPSCTTRSPSDRASPPARPVRPGRPTDNPYSRLAVDILETIREHELTMSSSIVAYLKMLVTLGHAPPSARGPLRPAGQRPAVRAAASPASRG